MMRTVIFLLFTLLFCGQVQLFAQPISSKTYGFSIEPPVEWDAAGKEDGSVLFFDSYQGLSMEVLVKTPVAVTDRDNEFEALFGMKSGGATLEKAQFLYNQHPTIVGLGSTANRLNHTFMLCINTKEFTYWIIGSIKGKKINDMDLSLIYSAMDSFALGAQGRYTPGPITQFDMPLTEKKSPKKVSLSISDSVVELDIDEEHVASAQRLIEREALIMSRYKIQNETAYLAWIRYYRFIYRDNFVRLAELAKHLDKGILAGKSDTQKAQILLNFSQNYYEYVRFTTPSDLIAPYGVILTQKGDCDAVGLLYIILLNYQKIDATLLLSQQLGHAIVGVKVEQDGASLELFETRYVSAEMTTKDPLGTVPARVAKTSDWFPILFLSTRGI
ncbi:MAG: hypothetical protein ACRCVN_05165 [Spirochaetia bacterium]